MLFMIGPFFLLAVCIGSYRVLAQAAYKRGLNEYAFGILGGFATIVAGALASMAGGMLDLANAELSAMFFGGLFFLPMEALYVGTIYAVIRLCPADAGEVAQAVLEQRNQPPASRRGVPDDREPAE